MVVLLLPQHAGCHAAPPFLQRLSRKAVKNLMVISTKQFPQGCGQQVLGKGSYRSNVDAAVKNAGIVKEMQHACVAYADTWRHMSKTVSASDTADLGHNSKVDHKAAAATNGASLSGILTSAQQAAALMHLEHLMLRLVCTLAVCCRDS